MQISFILHTRSRMQQSDKCMYYVSSSLMHYMIDMAKESKDPSLFSVECKIEELSTQPPSFSLNCQMRTNRRIHAEVYAVLYDLDNSLQRRIVPLLHQYVIDDPHNPFLYELRSTDFIPQGQYYALLIQYHYIADAVDTGDDILYTCALASIKPHPEFPPTKRRRIDASPQPGEKKESKGDVDYE